MFTPTSSRPLTPILNVQPVPRNLFAEHDAGEQDVWYVPPVTPAVAALRKIYVKVNGVYVPNDAGNARAFSFSLDSDGDAEVSFQIPMPTHQDFASLSACRSTCEHAHADFAGPVVCSNNCGHLPNLQSGISSHQSGLARHLLYVLDGSASEFKITCHPRSGHEVQYFRNGRCYVYPIS
jgi:hypothetical protein